MGDRNIALDISKFVFALMVVCMHSYFIGELNNTFSLLIRNGIFRFAVPVFFCINGFYFYSVTTSNKSFSWIYRILSLYLFWSLFYAAYWFKWEGDVFQNTIDNIYLLSIGFWHLWYLVGTIGAAVVVILVKNIEDKYKILLVIGLYASGSLIMYAGNYHLLQNEFFASLVDNVELHKNFLLFSFPYFMLGFLIRKFNFHEKIKINHLILLSALGILSVCTEAYVNRSALKDTFDSYISLIFACPTLFMLLLRIKLKGNSKNISLIANGIYFIHPLFIMYLNSHYKIDYNLLTLIVIFASIVTSLLLIRLNKKFSFIL